MSDAGFLRAVCAPWHSRERRACHCLWSRSLKLVERCYVPAQWSHDCGMIRRSRFGPMNEHHSLFARSQRIFKAKDIKSVPTLCVQGPYSEHCDFAETILFLNQVVSPVGACAKSEFRTRIRPVEPTEFTPFISVAVQLTASQLTSALTLTGGWAVLGSAGVLSSTNQHACSF